VKPQAAPDSCTYSRLWGQRHLKKASADFILQALLPQRSAVFIQGVATKNFKKTYEKW